MVTYTHGPANILAAGRTIVEGRTYKPDLANFLARDSGDALFARKFNVLQGILRVSVTHGSGRISWKIFGLKELNEVFALVREERGDNGERLKVLYGWGKESERGILDRARLRHCLAVKRGDGTWRPADHSLPRMNGDRESVRCLPETMLAGPAEDDPAYQKWAVIPFNDLALVEYRMNGRTYAVDGFNGHKSVASALRRERDRLVLEFYPDLAAAKIRSGPIRSLVIAERSNGAFLPLPRPRTIFSSVNYKLKPWRSLLLIREFKEYLLSDRAEGSYLDLEPRRVYRDGSVRFGIDTDRPDGGTIILFSYRGRTSVYGRVVTRDGKKTAYFWPDEAARAAGNAPIVPGGHVIAEREDGEWRIIYRFSTEQYREKRKLAFNLGNFIAATVGDKVFASCCPVYNGSSNGAPRKVFKVTCRGRTIDISLYQPHLGDRVYMTCRELGRRFKLLELWADQREFEEGKRPLAARFVAFKPGNGPWRPFRAGLNDPQRFRSLLKKKEITRNELILVLGADILISRYGRTAYRLLDALFF